MQRSEERSFLPKLHSLLVCPVRLNSWDFPSNTVSRPTQRCPSKGFDTLRLEHCSDGLDTLELFVDARNSLATSGVLHHYQPRQCTEVTMKTASYLPDCGGSRLARG